MNSDTKYIYEHYVESFDEEDYPNERAMIQAVLADVEHAEEYVLNFKGSIKGHRVLNHNRERGHFTLMADYISTDTLFADHFRW